MGVRPVGDKPLQSSSRKPSSAKGAGKEFQSLLKRSDESPDINKIQSLFESIENAAVDLIDNRGEEALKAYRKRVKEFLKEVLSESREVKVIIKDNVYDDPLVIVKIIDDRMDEMAALIIREEFERADLVKIIEEIKGILVDLYM